MIVKNIYYSKKFIKLFSKLPNHIKKQVVKIETIFKNNPLHPSLRLHQLRGRLENSWSISVTMDYRIIFDRIDGGDIFFLSVGKHDIYEK
ncbi:MAG: type II toxin-antitoxin system mRNA interferase toxin, RelE/StbE family [bacterium]|nr:type II toxin-antitoxin system mRNA interferase toxin, RelE/StbE family [bacterium]